MNESSIASKTRTPMPLFTSKRNQRLEEYAQAVDFYQKAVSALYEIDSATTTPVVRSLLTQADEAKRVVQQCYGYLSCYRTAESK